MKTTSAYVSRPDGHLFYDAFLASPIGIAVEDFEGRPLFVNPALSTMLGFSEEEMRSKRWIELSPPEDAEKDWALFEQLRAGLIDHYHLEKRFHRRDGSLIWGHLSVSVLSPDTSPLVVAMVEDVTEKRAAQEERARHAAIVEFSDDAIISKSLEGVIQSWNGGALRMFGYTEEEAIGRPITIIIPPDLQSEENDILIRLAAGEYIKHYETRRVAKNGLTLFVSLTVSPVKSAEGAVIGASTIVRDITARRRAEDELRQSELRLADEANALIRLNDWSSRLWRTRNLEEGLNEMLVAVMALLGADKGNVQLLDNQRRTLTIAAQHGFDQPFLDFFREVSANDPSACGRALRSGEQVVIEDVENDPAFRPLWSIARQSGYRAVVSTPLITGEGNLLGMLSTHFRSPHRPTQESLRRLDLYVRQAAGFVQRCQAERAMRESEERFRLLTNTAPVMIWMSGVDKACTYVNQRFLEFTGRPLEAVLGNGWAEAIHPEDRERSWDVYAGASEQNEPFHMEYRLRRHDGEYRWILGSGVPRFNSDGSYVGHIGSAIDVTERKLAEEALSTVSQRLIEAQEEERTRIARELHDDINQRLALLAVNLESLKLDLPASDKQAKRRIDEANKQVGDLGSDIQALSHSLHSSKLEYMGLVTASASFCKELSERQSVEIAYDSRDIPRKLPPDMALCLFRVLQEALHNAVRHSGARQFKVSLTYASGEIELSVTDSGVGFDPQTASGHGLGLTSMRERLKLVGGQLSIDSERQRGTMVRARVPYGESSRRKA
jgi:PAS domain S-box-containing protein